MPTGLQVLKANGDIAIDVTDRLTRYLGRFVTTTSNGSIVLPTGAGELWIFVLNPLNNMQSPSVRLNGNVASWVFNSGAGTWFQPQAVTVLYGVM